MSRLINEQYHGLERVESTLQHDDHQPNPAENGYMRPGLGDMWKGTSY
jgi:hypothetical protein